MNSTPTITNVILTAATQHGFEELSIEVIGMDPHGDAQSGRIRRDALLVDHQLFLTGCDAGIEELARQVEGHLAPDDRLLNRGQQHLPVSVQQLTTYEYLWRDVGGEVMTDPPVRNRDRGGKHVNIHVVS